MLVRTVLCTAFAAALFLPGRSDASSFHALHQRIGLIRRDHVALRSGASAHAHVLTMLVQQTQVEVLGSHGDWLQGRIWASVRGWVQKSDVVFRKPWRSVSTYRAPEIHSQVHATAPRDLRAMAETLAPVELVGAPGGTVKSTLPAGRHMQVTGWQQDEKGKIWYRISGLWGLGDAIAFAEPTASASQAHGRPLWSVVSGKGMWLTLGTIADSAPDAVVDAALRNHMTHLYLETAISPLGFHGRGSVGPLIDAAHKKHLAVIAWVYPYLSDVAADVSLTRAVAAYRTPAGQVFDGIAADLERNIQLWNVRAYSQLVRAYLGPAYLLVGVTWPPRSFPTYPFGEMGRTYNVLAPMDYWHQTQGDFGLDYDRMRYGYSYSYRYAADSVAFIHRVAGNVKVAPIGQTFDNFGRLEMGPDAPSATEIHGFLAGSKSSGAIGVSFFQWMTATVTEWNAIHDFRF